MSLQKNSHTIELWGLPGVGKTTLANRLAAEYGYKRLSPEKKSYNKLSLCLKYPRATIAWLVVILKNYLATKEWQIARYNVSLLFSSLGKIQFTKDTNTATAVIDEGFIQRALSYSDVTYTAEQLQKLFAHSPIGDVVIWVNDREVATERYSPQHMRAAPGSDYLAGWKKNQTLNVPVVAAALNKNKDNLFFETKHTSLEVIMSKLSATKI